MRTRAVCYVRVSGKAQAADDRWSLPDQQAKTAEYCRRQGYEVVGTFVEVHSGGDLWGRPELSDVLALAKQRAFERLVIVRFDRLAREINHQGYLISQLEHYRITIECTEESYDDNPQGKMLRMLAGMFAEIERHKIRDRAAAGLNRRVQSGAMIPSNQPLYGFSWRDAQKTGYELHPVTAPIVRRIFERVVAGQSLYQIVADLNADGVLTPRDFWFQECGKPTRGYKWSVSVMRRMILHPAYRGLHVANRLRWDRVDMVDEMGGSRTVRRQVARAEDDPTRVSLPDAAPAIVSRELADEAARLMHLNRTLSPRSSAAPEDALLRGGLVRCGGCGRAMHVRHYKGSVSGKSGRVWPPAVMYRCGEAACAFSTIMARGLDDLVWGWCVSNLHDPERWAERIRRAMQDDGGDQVAAVRAHIQELERQQAGLARTIARLADDEEAQVPLVVELRELGRQKSKAAEDLARLEAQRQDREAVRGRLDSFVAWARELAGRLDTLGYGDRRLVVRTLLNKVVVNVKGVEPRVVLDTPLDDCVTADLAMVTQLVLPPLSAWLASAPWHWLNELGRHPLAG